MIEVLHENHIEQEITDSDEYMFNLDSKLRQIRKLTQTIKSSNNTSDLKEKSTMNAYSECYIPTSNASNTNTSAVYTLNTIEKEFHQRKIHSEINHATLLARIYNHTILKKNIRIYNHQPNYQMYLVI